MLFFGVFFITSCEEPVDLDIAIQEPQIVVNSNFSPGHPFQITLTKSRYVLSSEAEEFVNNAAIKVYNEQGKEVEKLQLHNTRTPFYQSKKLLPESGKYYRVEIDVPGHDQIIAEDIVPFPIPLKAIQMDTIEVFSREEEGLVYKVEIKVDFEDPIGEQDFYHLSLYNQIPTKEGEAPTDGFNEMGTESDKSLVPLMPLESAEENPAVTFHYQDGGVLFTDEDFDGKEARLRFFSLLSFNNELQKGKVVGELRTVSKAYYLYHTSLSRQIANKDRPFVEPITVYSNIENGLGIFSGYSVHRDSVSIIAK